MTAKELVRRNRVPLIVFALSAVVYTAVAWPRPLYQSRDPHFVLQAVSWLEGRLEIPVWPAGVDDPAKVEEVKLKDGSVVRGRRITSRKVFHELGGREVALDQIQATVRTIHYVSFPPVPSVVLLPQVLVRGAKANDVLPTILFAALVPAAFLILLRRLREAGLSPRTPREELWLTACLAFGTVFFFAAVQGRVWFTAHVIGVFLAICYAWAAVEARHPLLAGLFLGLAFGTRTPILFMFPLFLWEAWRTARDPRLFIKRALLFAAPIAVIGLALAWHNWARFGEPTEFGHSYLAVRQQTQISQHGLFDAHYLVRNLVIAFLLVPGLSSQAPWISISGHGLAIWFTTPLLLGLLVWGRHHHPMRLGLWLSVALVAVWSLLYQNSGWVQFGYRFSLDYIVLLLLLVALLAPRLSRLAKAAIIIGIAVNLVGALTFDRAGRFYRQSNWDYDNPGPPFIVKH